MERGRVCQDRQHAGCAGVLLMFNAFVLIIYACLSRWHRKYQTPLAGRAMLPTAIIGEFVQGDATGSIALP